MTLDNFLINTYKVQNSQEFIDDAKLQELLMKNYNALKHVDPENRVLNYFSEDTSRKDGKKQLAIKQLNLFQNSGFESLLMVLLFQTQPSRTAYLKKNIYV